MMRESGGRALAAAIVLVAASLSGCNGEPAPPPRQPPSSSSFSPQAPPSETPSPEPSVRNDLSKLPLNRVISAGNLEVSIEYNTRLPLDQWEDTLPKPLHVTVTAVNRRSARQKIFLTRATATVIASNDTGTLESPPSTTDEAEISPGYIITSPNTYNQTFMLPSVDTSTTTLTIDVNYELVQEVARDEELGVRDFAKQVASDTIVVPIPK